MPPGAATPEHEDQPNVVIDGLSLFYVLQEQHSSAVQEAGVDATIVTFASDEGWDETLRKIEEGLARIDSSPNLTLATCVEDIITAKRHGKLAVLMGFQGADMIGDQLWRVGLLHRLGLRCLQLSYSFAGLYGDGCGERRDAGVSFLGRDLIATVNEYAMLLDLSHCGHRTTREAIDLATHPVCTHSNAYAVTQNDRNKKDDTIAALAQKGGILGATCLVNAVHSSSPTLEHVIDHIVHLVRVAGIENVGLGLDFTEGIKESGTIPPELARNRSLRPDIFGTVDDFFTVAYPKNIGTIRELPNVPIALEERGFSRDEVAALMGVNWFEHLKAVIG